MDSNNSFGLDFTLRELQIFERAILHLQNIEQNEGREELSKLFPSGFNVPETYWELKALEAKITKRMNQTPERQLNEIFTIRRINLESDRTP